MFKKDSGLSVTQCDFCGGDGYRVLITVVTTRTNATWEARGRAVVVPMEDVRELAERLLELKGLADASKAKYAAEDEKARRDKPASKEYAQAALREARKAIHPRREDRPGADE